MMTNFIFCIETESNSSILLRIIARLIRNRITIEDLQTRETATGLQRITFMMINDREHAMLLLKKISAEVEVISVKLFEQTV